MIKVVQFGEHDVVAFDKCIPWCIPICKTKCASDCSVHCSGTTPEAVANYNPHYTLAMWDEDGPQYWPHRHE